MNYRSAKILGAIPLIAVITVTLLLYFTSPVFSFDYAPLRYILVVGLLGIPSLIVAVISARAYLKYHLLVVLLLGLGVLMFGATQIATVFLTGSVYTNISASVFYLGSLVAVFLHVISSVAFTLYKNPTTTRAKSIVTLAFIGVLGLMFLIVAMALLGFSPVFIGPGGSTLVSRVCQVGIGSLYVFAAVLFYRQYTKNKSTVLYWYALALVSISITYFLLLASSPAPSLLAWMGRIAAYIGGIYFIVSIVSSTTKREIQSG